MTCISSILLASSVFVASVFCAVRGQDFLTNGLLAYYPFNGNADDASANGNHANANGTPLAPDRFGLPDNAYRFDGAANFITIPQDSIFASEDFTVSLWFNATVFPDMRVHYNEAEALISKGRNYFELHLGSPPFSDKGIRFLPRQDNGVSWAFDALSPNYRTNQWYHVVATWEGANHLAHMFLNGRELVIKDASGPADTLDNALPARLGTRYNGPGAVDPIIPGNGGVPFKGMLDDVRIYSRALSASEVEQLYLIEAPPQLNIKKAVYLDGNNLKLGTNYQLQVSSDLKTWTNHGSPFISTNANWRSVDYWDVDDWTELYFRLQAAP